MKTITLDFETYTKELEASKETGFTNALYAVTRYIMGGNTYSLSKENYYHECLHIDRALEEYLEKAIKAKEEQDV